ncbi:MAG: TraB/GumN family protein [Rhodanobacter sp.]
MKSALCTRVTMLLALLLPVAALAHPALWVVRDSDTTIYLFGTMHMLPEGTEWHFPALDQALNASDALYVEIIDDDPANMSALVLRYGLDTAHPLSGLLSAAEHGRLERAARLAGVPGGIGTLNIMRPWLAALTLTTAPLTKAGLDPLLGVDKALRASMERAGKPVHGLETAEQQIRFLADMPQALQLGLLRSAMRTSDHAMVELQALLDAWKAGDDEAIASQQNALMQRDEPRLYQHLLVDRNIRWAAQIKTMLEQPGTLFIAVGAAHLSGPDSVQAQLRQQGINSHRP